MKRSNTDLIDDGLHYSVSRLNEPKVSEAKYKFDFSAKFILQPD